jgi:hypothetical protein
MAIVAVFEFPGEPVEKYERVFEIGGGSITDQPKRLHHLCYRTEDGFTVVDIWEDEESFAAFGEIIGPVAAEAGFEPVPQVFPLQGYMGADGVRNP